MNKLLLDTFDDEDETVKWIDDEYYNCGCCDDCYCDDNVACSNCNCNCNIFEQNSEENEEIINNTEEKDTNKYNYKFINNYTINIIKENDILFIRINFEYKNDNTDENFYIDLDISRDTFLKIADELF